MRNAPALATATLMLLTIVLAAGASAQSTQCTGTVDNVTIGQCTQMFTECIATERNVTQGVPAVFPITVNNAWGADKIFVSLGAVCDPKNLECVFPDLDFATNTIAAGSASVYNLYVYTDKAAPGDYTIPLRVTGSTAASECSEDAELLLTVNPDLNATPAEVIGVYATLYPSEVAARPGDTEKFFVTLRNTLTEKAYASIGSAGTNPFEETTRYSYADVKLEAGETKVVEIDVTIPPGTPGMDVDWNVVVDAAGRQTVLPVKIAVHGPRMTLTTTGEDLPTSSDWCFEAKYGEPLEVRFGVRNDGDIAGPYSFSIESTEAAKKFAFLLPKQTEIAPGDDKKFEFTVAPRIETTLGTYHYWLVAEYLGYTAFRMGYCVRVSASENVSVDKQDAYEIVRAATNTASFKIRNTGSVSCDFALDVPPVQGQGLSLSISPASFTLAPKAEKTIDLVAGTTLATPLEDFYVPITLRSAVSSCNIAKDIGFVLAVVSSNRSGESLLEFAKKDYKAVESVATTYQVSVANKGSATLKAVRLEVSGVAQDWVSTSAPRDIPAGASRTFDLTFRPAKAAQGAYQITVSAVSGRERVNQQSALTVEPANKQLDFSAADVVPVQEGGATREARMSVTVKNTGNVPATQISPLLFSSEADQLLLETQPGTISLQPGQSATIEITVKPIPSADVSEQQVQLKLGSAEGASSVQSVKLPAMLGTAAKQEAGGISWKIVGIIVLLIAIFAIFAREEIEKRAKA